jgi:hypothetical protein
VRPDRGLVRGRLVGVVVNGPHAAAEVGSLLIGTPAELEAV